MHRRMHDDARHDALTGLANRLRLARTSRCCCGRVAALRPRLLLRAVRHRRLQGLQRRRRATPRRRRRCAASPARCSRRSASGDAVYRYGGEEFLVMLPEQSLETAPCSRPSACAGRRGPRRRASRGRRPDGQRRRRRARRPGLRSGEAVRAGRPGALPRQGGRPQPRRGLPRRTATAAGTAIRVLIADDDAMILLTLSSLIEREPTASRWSARPRTPTRRSSWPPAAARTSCCSTSTCRAAAALRAATAIRDAQPGRQGRRDQRGRQPGRAVRHDARRRGRLRRQGRGRRRDPADDPQRRALVITARP